MDLTVLQLFIEVMRKGSFAAVARDRNVDPSSVSRAIARLEDDLGIRLLQRTTRRLVPTEAGAAYFGRIEPLLEEMQQAILVATDLSGQPQGSLRVTASVSFGQHCLVPLLPEFQAQYPDLTVDLLLSDAVVDVVAERMDLAIRLGRWQDSTLISQRLMRTHYAVCASPDYLRGYGQPQDPGDITGHNCLLFPLTVFQNRWIFKDQQGILSEVPVSGRTLISNAIALQQCALAGMGLALLPLWLIQADLAKGSLVQILSQYQVTATDFETAAWLIYPSRSYVPSKVQVLIQFLKTAITTG